MKTNDGDSRSWSHANIIARSSSESDPGYFEIAKKRISEAQLQIRMPFPEASAE